jgi:hypothetical protein
MAGVLGVPIPLPNPSILGIGTKVPSNAAKRVSALTLLHNAGFTGTTREGEPADRAGLAIMHLESGGQADVVNPAADWPTWHPGNWRTAKDMLITVGPNSVGGAVSGAVSDVAGEAASVADAALGPVDEIASALLSRDTWFRVGKGFLGGLIVVIGTGAIVAIAARPLAKNVAKNTPAGALLGGGAKRISTPAPRVKPRWDTIPTNWN